MHMAHLSGNTSGVSKSPSDWLDYTGFPGDVCVAFFNVLPGNKNAVAPNPLTKEERRRVNISKVCDIESLKYVQEFYTQVCYCGDISTPLNMTRHKTKRDWLLYMSVIWPLGRGLAIQSGQSSQTFNRQSEGLAMRDYLVTCWPIIVVTLISNSLNRWMKWTVVEHDWTVPGQNELQREPDSQSEFTSKLCEDNP